MLIEIQRGERIEWCAVEFQGEILPEKSDERLDGYELGKCAVQGTKVTMEIGQHSMEGNIVELQEPFLVLKRDHDGFSTTGVISSKLVFKTRPQPIVKRQRLGEH